MRYTLLLLALLSSLSGYPKGIPSNDLFYSFRQGARGNCASVALIKAALNAYGTDGMFDLTKTSDSTYHVVFKDGLASDFTDYELKQASKAADFRLIRNTASALEIKSRAEIAYCAMAKYKLAIEKVYKANKKEYPMTFALALKDLNNGAYTPKVYKYLGLRVGKEVILLKDYSSVQKLGAVVSWSSNHAVYSSFGSYDDHGHKKSLSTASKYKNRFRLV